MYFKLSLLIVLPLIFSSSVSVAMPDQPQAAEPYQLVRSLRVLQDQVVTTKPQALPLLHRMLGFISADFASVDKEVWQKPENADAALLYLFNGGDPSVVQGVLTALESTRPDTELVAGALAYTRGQEIDVVKLLSVPSETDVSTDLRWSIILATTPKMATIDPAMALERLDLVRLNAPGTIFEEGAIRRSLPIAAKLGDVVRFRVLSRNYLQKYRYSPFFSNFIQQFVEASQSLKSNISDEELLAITADLPPAIRYGIYLHIARASLISGQTSRSQFMSAEAKKLADLLKQDSTQAELYMAASVVSSRSANDALATLETIPTSKLPEQDRKLLGAAEMIGRDIVATPKRSAENVSEASEHQDDVDRLSVEIRTKLSNIDALLQGTVR